MIGYGIGCTYICVNIYLFLAVILLIRLVKITLLVQVVSSQYIMLFVIELKLVK